MSDLILLHNPRCSKSRETLKLLQDHQVQPVIVEYLKDVPSKKDIQSILKKLGITARELIRKKEADYKALGLASEDLSDKDLIEAMHNHPKLIERPILIHGDKAAIGRPPEQVLDIL